MDTGTMMYRYLDDPAPFTKHERPPKTMDPLKEWQSQRKHAGKEADRATGVLNRLAEDGITYPVGQVADDSLRPGISAIGSPAECHVMAGKSIP